MKKIILTTLCCFFVFGSNVLADDSDEEIFEQTEIWEEIKSASAEPNKEPTVNSRACVVIDRNSKAVIYGKNENDKRAMASTTKIMTAILVLEKGELNQIIEVSPKAAGIGGSRLGLKKGDKISLNDLLYGLMLRSGNDAAVQIAQTISGSVEEFANLMNEKARELGLKNTNFTTPHGLDNPEHYTTAYELALLADYALQNKKFAEIVNTKTYTITINGNPKIINNTNELLGVLNRCKWGKNRFYE